jgi:hypothetical protein
MRKRNYNMDRQFKEGMRFGKLEVIKRVPDRAGHWYLKCTCGNTVVKKAVLFLQRPTTMCKECGAKAYSQNQGIN